MTSTPVVSPRRTLLVSASVALGLWALGLALGWTSGLDLPVAARDPGHRPWSEVVPIALTNLAAALGLMSGAVTAGLSTLGCSLVVALYAGGVVSAATRVWGAAGAVEGLLPFAALELGGLLCAAVAGLLPVVHAARSGWAGGRVVPELAATGRGYLTGLHLSFPWCAASITLVVGGALLEVVGGLPR